MLEVLEKWNNTYKFLIYSSRNAALNGTSGELLTMTLTASSTMAEASYQGRFYSQVFANADKQEYNPAESTFSVSVKKATYLKGDVNEDGKVDIADVTALVNIILEKKS